MCFPLRCRKSSTNRKTGVKEMLSLLTSNKTATRTKTKNIIAGITGEDVHYKVSSYRVKQADNTARDNRQQFWKDRMLKCKRPKSKHPLARSSQNCQCTNTENGHNGGDILCPAGKLVNEKYLPHMCHFNDCNVETTHSFCFPLYSTCVEEIFITLELHVCRGYT